MTTAGRELLRLLCAKSNSVQCNLQCSTNDREPVRVPVGQIVNGECTVHSFRHMYLSIEVTDGHKFHHFSLGDFWICRKCENVADYGQTKER